MPTTSQVCREIARQLDCLDQRVVFAESCTAGLVAATLAHVPGISRFLCGSAVTYRDETKAVWLKIPRASLAVPGPVSGEVARQMAEQVLRKTPEASVSASVTGHFGPQAPPRLDGIVYIAIAVRRERKIVTAEKRWKLDSHSRRQRQRETTRLVLVSLRDRLLEFEPHIRQ